MDLRPQRDQIDSIDRQIVKLLNERAKVAYEIGELKKKADLPVYMPDREAEVINNVTDANEGPWDDDSIMRIFEMIIEVTRSMEFIHNEEEQRRKGH